MRARLRQKMCLTPLASPLSPAASKTDEEGRKAGRRCSVHDGAGRHHVQGRCFRSAHVWCARVSHRSAWSNNWPGHCQDGACSKERECKRFFEGVQTPHCGPCPFASSNLVGPVPKKGRQGHSMGTKRDRRSYAAPRTSELASVTEASRPSEACRSIARTRAPPFLASPP